MEEINWDRIDKQKFFGQGLALFSGVTTLLFPLTVIKTRQMAAHSTDKVSGGLQGMKQTVRTIWHNEGVPGFYRGFATVIFGTMPARMIYLASLEVAKDAVTKAGHQLNLSQTATAGLANFAGGAAASLSIQLVTVPIDVISQRQMVHGASFPAPPPPAATPTPTPTPSTKPAPSAPTAAAPAPPTQSAAAGPAPTAQPAQPSQAPAPATATTGSTPPARPPAPQPTPSATTPATPSNPPPTPNTTAAATTTTTTTTTAPTNASSVLNSSQTRGFHTMSGVRPRPSHSVTSSWYALPQAQPTTTSAPNSSSPAYQQYQHQHNTRQCQHVVAGTRPLSTVGAATTAAASPAQGISGLTVARTILKEEGVRGFYRGFGMSVATFVPSSAVWWSAYGVYTQVCSSLYLSLRAPPEHLAQPPTQTPPPPSASPTKASSKASSSKSTSAPNAPQSPPAPAPPPARTLAPREVVGLQVSSAMLAGATASLITNPLDLIKTRIQVAVKSQGQAASVREVLREILKDDGMAGLLRGALPRMVNSAMWGTCMVSVYEFLKRVSVKTDVV